PGYVLVQIETTGEARAPRIDDECWHLVKETPKVMGFIGGTADKPLPIKDSEADAILNRVKEGIEKPRPKVLFEPGEMVRVIEGPHHFARLEQHLRARLLDAFLNAVQDRVGLG